MRDKKLIILPILILMFIGLAGLANATCTCDVNQLTTTVGTSNTYIRDGVKNISVNISCTVFGGENATAGIITASPGTITGATVFNITDGDINQSYMNFTVNTRALADNTQQTFTIVIKNTSSQATLATCTETFYSDNTKPVITGCQHVGVTAVNTTVTEKTTNTVSCTIYNATSCNAYWKDTTANVMATDYADIDCSFTATSGTSSSSASCSTKRANDGFNPWYFDCTDGLNTTTGTNYKFKLIGYSSEQEDQEEKPIGADKIITTKIVSAAKNKMFLLLALLVVVIMVGSIYLLTLKKK